MQPLRLPVRPARAADVGPLVPIEAQPAQTLKDRLDAGLGVALDISVVDAQHHDSLVMARVEPIEDKGARAAYMKKTGGRGRKTQAKRQYAGRG